MKDWIYFLGAFILNTCDGGIHAIEIYFPPYFVEQKELEKFDGVSEGKYTLGTSVE